MILLTGQYGLMGEPVDSPQATHRTGAFYTGKYPNLFVELLGLSESQVQAKIDSAFKQLFYGNDRNQRVYYPVGRDRAYIKDIASNDVRTEGMSYGMMIAVQLDKKKEFNRLWKWVKTFMQHQSNAMQGYFAWHCKTDGTVLSPASASDGEEWFITTLLLAAARWGNGEGMYNYQAEAQFILDAMLNKAESSDKGEEVTNMFNRKEKQIVFVPLGSVDDFTDPSYHLPHFYELWARWADKENTFWCEAAATSREFWKKATHPVTGLSPDYSTFDGVPTNAPWGGNHNDFRFDAWRTGAHIALDYLWFARDDWAIAQSNRLLKFFYSQGMGDYGNQYTLDGVVLEKEHSPGLVAMNAVVALAAGDPVRKEFVAELWRTPTPDGRYRYYDGLLYLMGLLQVSGNFRVYHLTGQPTTGCLD